VPNRFDAEQRQRRAQLLPAGTQRLAAPKVEHKGPGPITLVLDIALHKGVGEASAVFHAEPCRQRARIDTVKVAACWQDVGAASRGRRPGLAAPAGPG